MTPPAFCIGYAIGSISGARVVGRGVDFGPTEVTLDGTGVSVTVDGVSPSMLRARQGDRAGLRAAGFDIVKGVVPTLVARLVWGRAAAAAAGAGTVVGHAFPLHRRFRGGFGMSPMMGAMVVIDPIGLGATVSAGMGAGAAVGSAFAMTDLWPALTIPWAWRRGRRADLGFAVVASVVYFWRSRHEMRGAWRSWRRDDRPWADRVADIRTYPSYSPTVSP